MISLRGGGLVAAFFGARAGPGLALAPGSRGPGLALAPGSPRAHQKNAAINPELNFKGSYWVSKEKALNVYGLIHVCE